MSVWKLYEVVEMKKASPIDAHVAVHLDAYKISMCRDAWLYLEILIYAVLGPKKKNNRLGLENT